MDFSSVGPVACYFRFQSPAETQETMRLHELDQREGPEEAISTSKTATEKDFLSFDAPLVPRRSGEIHMSLFSFSSEAPLSLITILERALFALRRHQQVEAIVEAFECWRGRGQRAVQVVRKELERAVSEKEKRAELKATRARSRPLLLRPLLLQPQHSPFPSSSLSLSSSSFPTPNLDNTRSTPTTEASTRKTASSGGTAPPEKSPPPGSPTRSRSTPPRTSSTGRATA